LEKERQDDGDDDDCNDNYDDKREDKEGKDNDMSLLNQIVLSSSPQNSKTLKIRHKKVKFVQRGSRGIALLIRDLDVRRGWVVSTTPRPLYPGKDPVPIVKEAGWAPGPVWRCAKSLAPTGIRSPDRPARSQSLYRLSYSDPVNQLIN
jgi:hypothetical protein